MFFYINKQSCSLCRKQSGFVCRKQNNFLSRKQSIFYSGRRDFLYLRSRGFSLFQKQSGLCCMQKVQCFYCFQNKNQFFNLEKQIFFLFRKYSIFWSVFLFRKSSFSIQKIMYFYSVIRVYFYLGSIFQSKYCSHVAVVHVVHHQMAVL